jgi:hypothetical protein
MLVETLAAIVPDVAGRTCYAVRVLSTAVDRGEAGAAVISSRLEALLNELASDGWEFVSVQSVPALTIASHFGRGRISSEDVPADVCLAVFRRDR